MLVRTCVCTAPDHALPCLQGVRCVVHYQVPASADVYVHRSGRTARAGAEGIAVALVAPKDQDRYRALLQVRAGAAPV